MSGPAALVFPALKRHTATVIMAHGLGDSGAGWTSLAKNWRDEKKFDEVKFVFPNAPTIPITVNGGFRMPGWYDITDMTTLADRSEDEDGIARSRSTIAGLINKEVEAGIPANRVVIGGFSQGGAIALVTGLTFEKKLAGIFGLSTYLLLPEKLPSMMPADKPNKDTKIFLGHGDADPLVLPPWATRTFEKIKEWGYNANLKFYPRLPHSATEEEIDDLEGYLNEAIPALGEDGKL